FDGTIMCYDEPPGTFHPAAIEVLNQCAAMGAAWCTNSGRNHVDQQEIIARAVAKGLMHLPSALICSESLIFPRANGGYEPMGAWNNLIHQRMKSIQQTVQERLLPCMPVLIEEFQPEQHFSEHYTAFHIPTSSEQAAAFYKELCTALAPLDGMSITRNDCWINILPRETGKGNTLLAYARTIGVRPDEILAVGDHLNDLTMLDGSSAGHVGCPGNAVPEIIQTVRSAGGRVAAQDGPLGSVEIIRHCLGI
ncbi:MAG: HAD hydrolase family protein, partial [Lentisphaerota bacterium]